MKIYRNLYKKFIDKKLTLADQLAASRSILANERTFLSYQRTALTQAVAGLTLIKFFENWWFVVIGWLFIPAAGITAILGVIRYIRMRDLIISLEHETSEGC